jgi:ubiquinone biosynthesis protein UbiJ
MIRKDAAQQLNRLTGSTAASNTTAAVRICRCQQQQQHAAQIEGALMKL